LTNSMTICLSLMITIYQIRGGLQVRPFPKFARFTRRDEVQS